MKWPSHGIHEAVPFATYRADDITQADSVSTIEGKAVSKSLIVDFMDDPGSWKANQPKKQTGAMKAGSLLDCLLTTPHELESRYTVSPYKDFRTNESKAWRDEIEAAGIEVVTQDKMAAASHQTAAILAHPHAAKLLKGARMQVAFRHKTKYGFDAKGLIDIVPADDEILADLKMCDPRALESKRALQRYIFEWGYHVQAGGYCEGWAIASGEERTRFKFIFVSSSAPFRVAVVELPLAAILFGADLYRAGIAKLGQCFAEDCWPSMWDDEHVLDLPEYAYLENGI